MQPFRQRKPVNAGSLNKRITFQRKSTNLVDEDGFPIPEEDAPYEDVVSVWAMAKTVSGREYHQAAATQNERTTRWIIRYRKGLSEDMRILYDNRVFEIEAILPDDEARETLTVVCKEVV